MSTLSLAPRLAFARMRGRGGAALDLLAVLAFTISTFLALTVAGGTWMFIQRAEQPAANPDMLEPGAYVLLAVIACAFLVAPILGLGGAAARLGARGRSQRLATLRLVGMTGTQVVGIAVLEALVQAAVGVVLGTVLYYVSLPAWQVVSFQATPITPSEMVVPWWVLAIAVAGMLLLAVLSTVMGLQKVRISPLGVTRNQNLGTLRVWRIAIFAVLVVGFLIYSKTMFEPGQMELIPFLVIGGFIGAVVLSVNLIGPFILQYVALAMTRVGKTSTLLAARRVADDPKAAWRNVSGVALLGFVAAATAAVPTSAEGAEYMSAGESVFLSDLRTGVIITLLVALVVAATSTLISQASNVFDRAGESQALDRMGVPRGIFAAIRRRQVVLPLALALVVAVPLGFLLGSPFVLSAYGFSASGMYTLGIAVAFGFVLTILAAEACRPLQAGVLAEQRRRND